MSPIPRRVYDQLILLRHVIEELHDVGPQRDIGLKRSGKQEYIELGALLISEDKAVVVVVLWVEGGKNERLIEVKHQSLLFCVVYELCYLERRSRGAGTSTVSTLRRPLAG